MPTLALQSAHVFMHIHAHPCNPIAHAHRFCLGKRHPPLGFLARVAGSVAHVAGHVAPVAGDVAHVAGYVAHLAGYVAHMGGYAQYGMLLQACPWSL